MSDNGNKKPYNPNRFNATDAALAYIVALAAFAVLPYIMRWTIIDFLKALYGYDVYLYLILDTFISQFAIFLIAVVFSAVRRANPFNGGGYAAKWDWIYILFGVILVAGIMTTLYETHSVFGENASYLFGEAIEIDENFSPLSGLYALVYIILSAVLPAICEEMLFRGIIMRGLESFGKIFAVVVSSLAFALMHGNFEQLILQFVGGLAIGSVVMITGNWLVGSVMHFFNNIFAVIYGIMTDSSLFNENVYALTTAFSILIGVVFSVVGVVYFGAMVFEKAKKVSEKNAGGTAVYLSESADGVREIPYSVKMPLYEKGCEDKYFICGKFRRANGKANAVLSIVLLAIGVSFAAIRLFI